MLPETLPCVGDATFLTFDELAYGEQCQVYDSLQDEGLDCDEIVFAVYRRTRTGILLTHIGAIH